MSINALILSESKRTTPKPRLRRQLPDRSGAGFALAVQAPSSGHCLLQSSTREQAFGGKDMATFDTLIDVLAGRFGLGANARTLVREVLTMISTSPGGLGGFIDKLKSAGLTSEVASWLGSPNAAPLAAGQIERALGATAVGGVASRLGLGQGAVSTALGYALPKIIGLLTPGGVVPAGVPAEVTTFLSQPRLAAVTEQVAPKRIDVLPASAESESSIRRWLWRVLAALVVVALLSYFWSTLNRMPSAPPIAKAPEPAAPATVAQAPPPPAPTAQAP